MADHGVVRSAHAAVLEGAAASVHRTQVHDAVEVQLACIQSHVVLVLQFIYAKLSKTQFL